MRKKTPWFKLLIQLRGSVIAATLPQALVVGAFGVGISVLYALKLPVSQPISGTVIPSVVLGLLLVFRTNTAYERFWEGRKHWGSLVNTGRNLARQIWVAIPVETLEEQEEKISALRLLVAFAVSTKLHLRQESNLGELKPFLSSERYEKIQSMQNPPLEVAFWIADYLQYQHRGDRLSLYQLRALHELVDNLVNALGSCERILKTPMPLAYAIHLKQLIWLYCLLLPFQLVGETGWLTGPVVVLVSFTLFGIEGIGLEIENPFGHDPNDLPLDSICQTMQRNIEDLISLAPSYASRL